MLCFGKLYSAFLWSDSHRLWRISTPHFLKSLLKLSIHCARHHEFIYSHVLSKAFLLTFQDLYIFVDCWALSSVSVFTPWLPSVRPAVAAAAAGRRSVSPDEQPQQSDHVQWDPEQPHHQQPEHQPKPRATVPWPLPSASHTEKGLCPNILLQRPTPAFWFWR